MNKKYDLRLCYMGNEFKYNPIINTIADMCDTVNITILDLKDKRRGNIIRDSDIFFINEYNIEEKINEIIKNSNRDKIIVDTTLYPNIIKNIIKKKKYKFKLRINIKSIYR